MPQLQRDGLRMTRVRFPNVARRVGPGFARERRTTVRDVDIEALLQLLTEAPQDRHFLSQRLQVTDRKARMIVEEARVRGHLVIWQRHERGPGGLYRIAASRTEYDTWKRAETLSRLGTFAMQLRAMDATADRTFPPEQLRLVS